MKLFFRRRKKPHFKVNRAKAQRAIALATDQIAPIGAHRIGSTEQGARS
ncbi:MAG: hypothetical protein ACK4R2_11350 [Roseateles sp.]